MPSSLCIHACRLEEVRQSVLSTHLFATHRPTHHSVRVLVPCMPISHYYKSNYIHWNLGKYISITVMLIVLRLSFVFLSSFFPPFLCSSTCLVQSNQSTVAWCHSSHS